MSKEVLDNLKSAKTTKVEELKALQAEGVEALKSLDEAREAKDEGLVSEASEKFEKVSEAIKSVQDEIEKTIETQNLFKEYNDEVEITDADFAAKAAEVKNLIAEITAKSAGEGAEVKKSPGQYFADVLAHYKISRVEDFKNLNVAPRIIVPLVKEAMALDEVKSASNIKSIYSNHGAVFTDASAAAVPGFVGFQCGLVEDTSIGCLLDPPAEDFEECITQRTLTGNRVRFVREAARLNNAASVLETIYNPYPDMEQDGTKPEGGFTLEDVTVKDVTIAEFITASDRVLEDCSFVAQHIDHVLISNVNEEKRRQLIEGTGTNGEMLGILNQPNVLSRTHQDAGDGGAATDNIYDTFRRAMTDLWFQNAPVDSLCVIMNPRDGEIIDLTKDDMGRYLFNDSDCFNRNLRCLKIRYSTTVPEGTAVMGNFAGNWEFWMRKALSIRVGLTGDQFITNTQTILAEMRALALLRCPRKVIKIDGLA
jgi:hypothetical protein